MAELILDHDIVLNIGWLLTVVGIMLMIIMLVAVPIFLLKDLKEKVNKVRPLSERTIRIIERKYGKYYAKDITEYYERENLIKYP